MINADVVIAEIIRREGEGQLVSNRVFGKEVVFIMGNTGVGKSTFVNYLLGCKMKEVKANEIGLKGRKKLIVVDSESPSPEIMKIGHGDPSATSIPTIHVDPTDSDRIFCDCPGFFDNRGSEVNISNSINIRQILRIAATVKIIFLADYRELEVSRGSGFSNLESMCLAVFGGQENFANHKNSFLFGITNAPPSEEDPISFEDVPCRTNTTAKLLCEKMFFYDPLDRALYNECFWDKDDVLQEICSLDGIPNSLEYSLFQTILTEQDQMFVTRLVRNKCNDFTRNIDQGAYERAGEDWKVLRSLKVIQSSEVERTIDELAMTKLVKALLGHVSDCMAKVYKFHFQEAENDLHKLKVFISCFPNEGLELHILQLEESIRLCKHARENEVRAQKEKVDASVQEALKAYRLETERGLKEKERQIRKESKGFLQYAVGGLYAVGAGAIGFVKGAAKGAIDGAVECYTWTTREWEIDDYL